VVERIRESPEGVPCSGRVVAAMFRQVKARFEYACMFLSNNYLQALDDKDGRGMLQYMSTRGWWWCWSG
jgi:hypothetical protein